MICQQLAFRSKKCINKHRYRDKANGIKHQLLNLGGVYGESFWLFPFSSILEIFWMNTGRCPSAGPWVGKIAEKVVSPWKCNGSIQSCGVKTYFLPLSLFSYDLGLEASSLWALLPCLGVEITTPPAWRAVMRNGCVDLAWTQHKIRLFSAQLTSPPPPQKSSPIVEAYSKPLLLQGESRTYPRWSTGINRSLFCRSTMFINHMHHPRSPNIQSNYFQTFLQRVPSLWKEATEDRKCFYCLHLSRKSWPP